MKRLVQSALRSLGLDVRRAKSHHVDAFADQVRLLSDTPVETIFDVGAFDGRGRGIIGSCFHRRGSTVSSRRNRRTRSSRRSRKGMRRCNQSEQQSVKWSAAPLHLNRGAQTNSLLPNHDRVNAIVDPTEMAPTGAQTVPVVTLDGFCDEHHIERIDLLKMDIQGFELHALRGAQRLLERGAIRLIYTEVLFSPLYDGQAYCHDIAVHLAGFGYELYGLYSLMRVRNGALGWGDAIFRKAS